MCIEVSNGKEDPEFGVGRSNHQVTQSSSPTIGGTPNHVGSHSENTNLLLLRLAWRKNMVHRVWGAKTGMVMQAFLLGNLGSLCFPLGSLLSRNPQCYQTNRLPIIPTQRSAPPFVYLVV